MASEKSICAGYSDHNFDNFDPSNPVIFSDHFHVPTVCGKTMRDRRWMSLDHKTGEIKTIKMELKDGVGLFSDASQLVPSSKKSETSICNSKITEGKVSFFSVSEGSCANTKDIFAKFKNGSEKVQCRLKWRKSELKLTFVKAENHALNSGKYNFSKIVINFESREETASRIESFAFGDYDLDGELDLRVTNFIDGDELILSSGNGTCDIISDSSSSTVGLNAPKTTKPMPLIFVDNYSVDLNQISLEKNGAWYGIYKDSVSKLKGVFATCHRDPCDDYVLLSEVSDENLDIISFINGRKGNKPDVDQFFVFTDLPEIKEGPIARWDVANVKCIDGVDLKNEKLKTEKWIYNKFSGSMRNCKNAKFELSHKYSKSTLRISKDRMNSYNYKSTLIVEDNKYEFGVVGLPFLIADLNQDGTPDFIFKEYESNKCDTALVSVIVSEKSGYRTIYQKNDERCH